MASWVQRQQEESYLEQLDQMVLQRLRRDPRDGSTGGPLSTERGKLHPLTALSREINEELDRLEEMLEGS